MKLKGPTQENEVSAGPLNHNQDTLLLEEAQKGSNQ